MDKLVGAFSGVLKTSGTPPPPQPAPSGDRQYLRLPLESARKLRWFEKSDLQALTKSHFREKRELLDTLTVVKKLLVRHGLDEAKLDAEVSAHLRTASELAEEHEGVASVLLAGLESHVQQLRFENERLQAAIKMGQHVASSGPDGAPAQASDSGTANGAISTGASAGTPLLNPAALLPRRLEHLDLAHSGSGAKPRLDPLARQQIAALEARCDEYAKEVSELKATVAKLQSAAAGRRRGQETTADVQDMLLSLQEATREEARKASLAEARAARLEGELRTLQAQHKGLGKENTGLQQQVAQLREEMEAAAAEAAARIAEAAAAGEGAKAAVEAREEAAALRQALSALKAELVSAHSSVVRLEADVQAVQQRESATAAALAEAEAVAGRNDELAAANMVLMQRLADSKTELEMAAYYKKVCGELTEAKALLEEQLLGLGSLLSASELRLADMAARASAADEQAALAECRARAVETSVAAEVERRCATVLSSRALWPLQLRDEVESLESRLGKLEAEHAALVRRAEAATRGEVQARDELHVKSVELAVLTNESAAATTAFAAQLQQLREALAESQARAAGLQDELAQSRLREEAAASSSASAGAVHRRHSSSGAGLPGAPSSGSSTTPVVMTPKWQVQNKVGGGGLYNLDAAAAAAAGVGDGGGGGGLVGGGGALRNSSSNSSLLATAASVAARKGGGAGGAGPPVPGSVDAVYLKNVMFKFLEAHLTNKVQERDMLLPAVATLLQATQEEFVALQKIMRATQPPSRQMLSVLGLSR